MFIHSNHIIIIRYWQLNSTMTSSSVVIIATTTHDDNVRWSCKKKFTINNIERSVKRKKSDLCEHWRFNFIHLMIDLMCKLLSGLTRLSLSPHIPCHYLPSNIIADGLLMKYFQLRKNLFSLRHQRYSGRTKKLLINHFLRRKFWWV